MSSVSERLADLSDEVDRLKAEGRFTKAEHDRIHAEVEKIARRGDDFEFLHMAADPSWFPPRKLPPYIGYVDASGKFVPAEEEGASRAVG